MQVKLIKQYICSRALKLGRVGKVFIGTSFVELSYDLHVSSLNRCFEGKKKNCKGKPAFITKFPNNMLVCLTERINTRVELNV